MGQVVNVTMKAWQTSGAKYWQGSEAWAEIQHATDMTLDMLRQVDWVQVLTNVAKTVGVILVAVGIGVLVVTLGIPEAIIGAFLLIVRLAISAWGTLAAILGTGTAALAAG